MGYRSDIKVVFYAHDAADFSLIKLWVDENMPKDDLEISCPPTEFVHGPRKGLLYEFNGVKWYPNYEDVKAFESAMARFEDIFDPPDKVLDQTSKGSYEFVRIGEEYEDIERKSSDGAWGVLQVNRSVELRE